jgi:hypothetical protein
MFPALKGRAKIKCRYAAEEVASIFKDQNRAGEAQIIIYSLLPSVGFGRVPLFFKDYNRANKNAADIRTMSIQSAAASSEQHS